MSSLRTVSPSRLALSLLAICALASCATNPVTKRPELVFMSEADEIKLGQQMHPQVLEQYGRYDDPALQEYVDQVGQAVAAKSDRNKLKYTFTLLDSDEVNAFAIPGGYVYVTRGILSYLNSEAELSAVLGHEVGHVAARHPVRQQSQSTLAGIGAAAVGIFTGNAGLGELANYGGSALVRGYGRDMELEADRLGAEYITREGYSSENMIKVVRLLKNQETFEIAAARQEGREPKVYHGVFATHPDNDTRLREVVRAAGDLTSKSGESVAAIDDKREPYLQHLEGLAMGSSRAQGVTRGSRFYHADMGFTVVFPAGWVLQNLSDRLVAISPDKTTLVQMQTVAPPANIGPKEMLGRALAQSGISRGEELDINGLKAYAAIARSTNTPFGQAPARCVVIYYNNLGYMFLGASKGSSGAPAADALIMSSIKTFRRMKDNEFALAEPHKIQLVRAAAGTKIETVAQQAAVEKYPVETLRLLNDLYPDKQPQEGQLLKTVKD
jgi:predicted Zn-dependent protease